MAIDALVRWESIRKIICNRKSGTLTLQRGPNYLYWSIQDGWLTSLFSTLPEDSFTQFILNNRILPEDDFRRAQLEVSEIISLGAVLVKMKLASVEVLRRLLQRHWSFLSYRLLQSSSHFFWSSRQIPQKPEFVGAKMSFGELILRSERDSVEPRSAIRFAGLIPMPYRIDDWAAVAAGLCENEKRILHYLKRSCCLTEILKDAELDRMTCYRVLFLLWLSGHLREKNQPLKMIRIQPIRLVDRVKSIPPDWIFPLTAGALVGALLVPSAQTPPAQTAPSVQREIVERPAWSEPLEPVENDKRTE